jgi:ubiquinone/menaquinone biosynthesis C-methylase UbiE
MGESAAPGDLQRRVAERYAEDADAYRRLWAPVLHPHGRHLLQQLGIEHARRVLDVGTGVGSLLPDIREQAPAAFALGIDRSFGMLSLAPWNSVLAVMDGARTAFKPGVFDVLVMAFVLQHFPEPAEALWEARRVLGPAGRVGVATWGADPGCAALDVWTEELDVNGARPMEPLPAAHHLMDSEDKVRGLLEDAGFWAIRTWTDTLNNAMDVDAFLAIRAGFGIGKRRFATLDAGARDRCLARVRDRLAELDPADLVEDDEVVFATALKAR